MSARRLEKVNRAFINSLTAVYMLRLSVVMAASGRYRSFSSCFVEEAASGDPVS